MRVTRESLIRIAKETSHERSYNDRSIVAAYLTGSLTLDADPMLGGTTDIDLVFVHGTPPGTSREIVKLTPDFHLDVRHRLKADFRSPRELRTDPILGCEMYDPMLLSEREKFFEFVQAGLRAGFEFYAPSLVLARCRKLLAEARKTWLDLTDVSPEKAGAIQVKQFLRALTYAANTVAELNGGPLPERRFLVEFPVRAVAAERPELAGGLLNLLGAGELEAATIQGWMPAWKNAFIDATFKPGVDQNIHPARLNYYERAIEALLAGETPLTALWPMLNTWTLAVGVLGETDQAPWQTACRHLGILGPGFGERVSALDSYMDQVEIRLDEIAMASGLETSTSI